MNAQQLLAQFQATGVKPAFMTGISIRRFMRA